VRSRTNGHILEALISVRRFERRQKICKNKSVRKDIGLGKEVISEAMKKYTKQ